MKSPIFVRIQNQGLQVGVLLIFLAVTVRQCSKQLSQRIPYTNRKPAIVLLRWQALDLPSQACGSTASGGEREEGGGGAGVRHDAGRLGEYRGNPKVPSREIREIELGPHAQGSIGFMASLPGGKTSSP